MLFEDAGVLREDKARACEARGVYPEFDGSVVDGVVEKSRNIPVVEW